MSLSLGIAYHIMIRAEKHGREIHLNNDQLVAFISGLLEKKRCQIYAIAGRGNQLHTLISLDPKVALDDLLQEIMRSTEEMIRTKIPVKGFRNWEKDYWAYTHSIHRMDHIIDFIRADDEEYQEERRAREDYLYHMRKRCTDIDDDSFFDELSFMDI
ncbi:MAG: transposase [Candidatus Neomarinimicrobiota bacterium]|jgi:REP element-mobilizing transposase RayT|nr:transposase [Candidatus Neomarinimicrobiota bacterium]MDD3965697.1 transposase [Candidatus Neomarinimicrobiota bacterium]MDX9780507.1 transposase [bacterium]